MQPADAAGLHDWSGAGADAGLEASGHRDGFEALIAALRPGGRVVCCGYAPGSTYELDSMRLVLAELSVLGSRASSREDARLALASVEQGRVTPTIDRALPLERVNEGLRAAPARRAGRAGSRSCREQTTSTRGLDRKEPALRAAVLNEPRTELELQDRERPEPGAGEVLIRVRACGICHSDVALQEGYYDFASFPRVPGHEIAGTIEAAGEGVAWPAVGARVGMPWLFTSCGHCRQCIRGNEILCPENRFTGVNVDGGYQEFMLAPANYVAPLPDELDFAAAAPLMCAGITVYNGLRLAELQPGDRVAVIGLGGLGFLGVQYARAMGGPGRGRVLEPREGGEGHARWAPSCSFPAARPRRRRSRPGTAAPT